ncbi:tripartite tricarboxylate transporter permease [Mycolicibacterium farcinogenes]|uniref:tripartite tricarboxylate transporter permease n=1 Tax=Mycolicibacterium farcinogenes TaxID=1802 RepID=UPI001C8DC49A|nr:tripartite tricarboxylate transporter permease [Mycolicibacterium farcinogenes]QZH60912.1 tripartite tricarboxylate transporter permease [Mycolicibacterium farcinogenes]
MNGALDGLLIGFQTAATWENLLFCVAGVLLGTITGVLPGFGPVSAIAVLLPITYNLEPSGAIIMLAGIYIGAQYAGSTTAILLGIPGEPSSVMTVIDGNKLAKLGRAGKALGIAAVGSFIAGTISLMVMTLVAQPLGQLAIKIQPPEMFCLVVMALFTVAVISGESLLKGVAMAALGLVVSLVGVDMLTGGPRLTLGIDHLLSGIPLIVLALGIFAVREVVATLSEEKTGAISWKRKPGERLLPTRKEVAYCAPSILRSTGIGFTMGVLPGAGATTASFLSYGAEKAVSKRKDEIGNGSLIGVAAPESSNNAAATGAFIPLLTLGIPGSGSTAMLLGAFILVGVQPGPMLFDENPDIAWSLIASFYVANVLLLVLNLPLVGVFVKILRTPYSLLSLIIVVCTMVGAFTAQNALPDLWILLIVGIAAFYLSNGGYPMAPLLLGCVLGRMLDETFRQSLALSTNGAGIFLQRPITLASIGVIVAICGFLLFKAITGKQRKIVADE